jgi:hypothetical protein
LLTIESAIDDCPRLRVLEVYDACNHGAAIEFIDEVLRRLPVRSRYPDGITIDRMGDSAVRLRTSASSLK